MFRKAEKEKLAAKIAAMEGKLLTGGGKTIVDHTNEQQRALEQRRAEVAARLVGYSLRPKLIGISRSSGSRSRLGSVDNGDFCCCLPMYHY